MKIPVKTISLFLSLCITSAITVKAEGEEGGGKIPIDALNIAEAKRMALQFLVVAQRSEHESNCDAWNVTIVADARFANTA